MINRRYQWLIRTFDCTEKSREFQTKKLVEPKNPPILYEEEYGIQRFL
jgi:hypothetical protein